MEKASQKISTRERQLHRSRRYRTHQAAAGYTPVIVFLNAVTRAKLKALAPSLECPKQLPAVVAKVVASYLGTSPAVCLENTQTIGSSPSAGKGIIEPSPVIKKVTSVRIKKS